MKRELIERAIESAKARIYRLAENEKYGVGEAHQKKIDNQKEVMEVTVEALERMLPKRPRKGGVMGFDGEEGAYCPNCGLDNMAWGMSVCVDCGQRLDWGEEHE